MFLLFYKNAWNVTLLMESKILSRISFLIEKILDQSISSQSLMIELVATKEEPRQQVKATHSRGSLLRHEIEADFHEPIFIPHHSRCCWCGPQDHHCRLETFEVIEVIDAWKAANPDKVLD